MSHSLRGHFEARIGGEPIRFDTTLGTIASIEDRCGDTGIVDIINKAVFGRRARDQIALIAAALAVKGCAAEDAAERAALASVAEAEGFILALMGALGFEVGPRGTEETRPLDGASAGRDGASSRSAA